MCTCARIHALTHTHTHEHSDNTKLGLHTVLLVQAQAQECILEKSMIDSRKNTITAKVSAQVVEFYRLSIKNLNQCNSEQIINSRSYKVHY